MQSQRELREPKLGYPVHGATTGLGVLTRITAGEAIGPIESRGSSDPGIIGGIPGVRWVAGHDRCHSKKCLQMRGPRLGDGFVAWRRKMSQGAPRGTAGCNVRKEERRRKEKETLMF